VEPRGLELCRSPGLEEAQPGRGARQRDRKAAEGSWSGCGSLAVQRKRPVTGGLGVGAHLGPPQG
jgi:hypothetical protein